MENKTIDEFEKIAEDFEKNTIKIFEDYKKRLEEIDKKYGNKKK